MIVLNHKKATKYLRVASLFFSFAGIYWAVSGQFDPFGLYKSAFLEQFLGLESIQKEVDLTFTFLLGPLGATCAGYFLMQYFIATYAYSKKEKWAYFAIVIPFTVWFTIDTIMCLYLGAYFNIYFANLPALAAMLPIYFTYRNFDTEFGSAEISDR